MTETLAPSASSRRAWAAVIGATGATLAVLAAWLLGTSTGSLRETLRSLQPWWLDSCVLIGMVIAVCLLYTVDRATYKREIPRLAVLAAFSVALTLFVAPRTNRIYYDEQIYQAIGQNIADIRLAQVCNDGAVEYGRLRCASGEYNKQPYGYPHVLSLAYRLLGVHTSTAFAVNALVMAATVCGVYLLVLTLFGDRDAALFAGLLVSTMPEQLLWSATAAVEPSASLALVTSLLCAGLYLRVGGWLPLAATAVASAYAIQFRPESLLILPVIGFMIWPRLRFELDRTQSWWAATLFLWLAALHLAHLFAVRHTDWGTTGPRFSFRYFEANLPVNGWFYLYDERFPMAFTALAVAGLFSGRQARERVAMAFYFLLFFAVDLLFYAGSYNYGADVRYSLMTFPPIAVLGGLGTARLVRLVAERRISSGVPLRPVVVTILLFQFLWYAPVVRATTEEAWAARADVRFAQTVAGEIPRNSYVLTHNPGMFHLWGVNAGQMSLVTSNPAYVRFLADRYSGGVYLHWNFWCNAQDPPQQEICRDAFAIGSPELVTEYRERDQRFAFYRMKVSK
jgi:dolichyl-phosphate-mannose-protein mannosyltransferase